MFCRSMPRLSRDVMGLFFRGIKLLGGVYQDILGFLPGYGGRTQKYTRIPCVHKGGISSMSVRTIEVIHAAALVARSQPGVF